MSGEAFTLTAFMVKYRKSILDQSDIKICCACVSAVCGSTRDFLCLDELLGCECGVNTTCQFTTGSWGGMAKGRETSRSPSVSI